MTVLDDNLIAGSPQLRDRSRAVETALRNGVERQPVMGAPHDDGQQRTALAVVAMLVAWLAVLVLCVRTLGVVVGGVVGVWGVSTAVTVVAGAVRLFTVRERRAGDVIDLTVDAPAVEPAPAAQLQHA